MNSLLNYKKEKIGNNSQFIVIDEHGFATDSCESLFNTNTLKASNVSLWCPFMESIIDFLLTMNIGDPELCFSRIDDPLDILQGFYDFTFSKVLFEGKERLLWQIYDHTHLYKDFQKHQQSCNEMLIKNERTNAIHQVLKTQRRVLGKRASDFQHLQAIKANYYSRTNSCITPKARIGASHLLKRKITDKATIDYIDAIEKSLYETKDLVEELMILTNSEGNIEFGELEFDIYDLLNEVSDSLGYVSLGKGIKLNISVHKGVPEHMIGNFIYLKHLINGLVSNYAKLIQEGTINVKFDPMEDEGRQLLKIKFDLKSNLDNDSLNALFEATSSPEQGDSTPILKNIKTEIELRLTILRKFVEQHHGHFSVQNSPNSGADISFSFPFRQIA